jgi:hypothetical protein
MVQEKSLKTAAYMIERATFSRQRYEMTHWQRAFSLLVPGARQMLLKWKSFAGAFSSEAENTRDITKLIGFSEYHLVCQLLIGFSEYHLVCQLGNRDAEIISGLVGAIN